MTRMVMCRKYGQEMEGLAFPPFPAAKAKLFLTRYLNRHGKNGLNTKRCSLTKII